MANEDIILNKGMVLLLCRECGHLMRHDPNVYSKDQLRCTACGVNLGGAIVFKRDEPMPTDIGVVTKADITELRAMGVIWDA